MTEEINFKAICDLTTNVLGLSKGELSQKSRKRKLQAARASAAYIGLKEAHIHKEIVAKELKRDRSLMYHYENSHKHNYATCLVYRNTFNKVYTAYKEIDSTKKEFLDGEFMKRHLLNNGVEENDKSQVFLEIKSGKACCVIMTSYFEFSTQLENVKEAMSEYHYTVKIL